MIWACCFTAEPTFPFVQGLCSEPPRLKTLSNTCNVQPKPRENAKAYGSIRAFRRILNLENIKKAFKPLKTLGHVFRKPKERNRIQSEFHLHLLERVKEAGSSLGGTNRNVGCAVKQHAETTGHMQAFWKHA